METKKATFTDKVNFNNWKNEFKNSQKLHKLFNYAGTAKSTIVESTKKVMEMKVIKSVIDYVKNHPILTIATLWILAIMIMGSILMGSIAGGLIFTVYMVVYTIMYVLAYYFAVGIIGFGFASVMSFVNSRKENKKTD